MLVLADTCVKGIIPRLDKRAVCSHFVLMTLELANQAFRPGYAGPLQATRHPSLARRFHFWRGVSGRRYACTKFPAGSAPPYDDAILLFVRRRRDEPVIVAVGAGALAGAMPPGIDEIHVHLVRDGAGELDFAFRDLAALTGAGRPLHCVERRAA